MRSTKHLGETSGPRSRHPDQQARVESLATSFEVGDKARARVLVAIRAMVAGLHQGVAAQEVGWTALELEEAAARLGFKLPKIKRRMAPRRK